MTVERIETVKEMRARKAREASKRQKDRLNAQREATRRKWMKIAQEAIRDDGA